MDFTPPTAWTPESDRAPEPESAIASAEEPLQLHARLTDAAGDPGER